MPSNFSNDPPPRVINVPFSSLVKAKAGPEGQKQEEVYIFGGRRKFYEPVTPGIYDPSTDPEVE